MLARSLASVNCAVFHCIGSPSDRADRTQPRRRDDAAASSGRMCGEDLHPVAEVSPTPYRSRV